MKYAFCALMSLLAFAAAAQSDFRAAYYIKQKGDTVRGFIDFRGDVFNAYNCHFKPTMKDDIRQIEPDSIREYRFSDGRLYVSKTVSIDKSGSHKTIQEKFDGELKVTPVEKETLTVFLECLVRGELTTYFLRTREGVEYFFVETRNGDLQTLDNNEIMYRSKDGTVRYKDTNQYVGALSYYAKDHPDLRREASKLLFNRKAITDFSIKYHDKVCASGEQCLVYEGKVKKDLVRFGAFAKGLNGSVSYRSPEVEFEGSSASFGVGMLMDFQMNNTSERFFLNLKLSYERMSIDGEYVVQINHLNQKLKFTCDVSSFRFSPSLMYIYPRHDFKPVLFLGVFVDGHTFSDWKRDGKSFTDENAEEKMITIGLNTGAGIQYKKHLRFGLALDLTPKRGSYTQFSRAGIEYALYYIF
jgi:hypothetical protein